jgi:8-oxo-dGTP pyrophosphatase MutT (NUDIX family)
MKNVWCWIIIRDKRILLIKRSKNRKFLADFWGLPWWRQEWNEIPEETTIREVKEEVWLKFEILRLFTKNIIEKVHYHDFLWNWTWKIVLQTEECDWYWWFTFEEAKYLPIVARVRDITEKLVSKNLIN